VRRRRVGAVGSIASLLAALAIVPGCRHAREVAVEVPALVVQNRSGVAVQIVARDCSAPPDSAFAPLPGALVGPLATARLPLEGACTSYEAVAPDGRVMGRQHDVRVRATFVWTIAP
jgi:hypothetical protein